MNHLARLYTAAGAIVVFFLLWATVAAHPWAKSEPTAQDPRLVALAQREKSLQRRAAEVKQIVAKRWAVYEKRAAQRRWQNEVALQRYVRQLQLSQASALRAAHSAAGQTAQARAYAASVVAWANQQLQTAAATSVAVAPVASVAVPKVAGTASAPVTTPTKTRVAAPSTPTKRTATSPTTAPVPAPVAAAPVAAVAPPAPPAQPAPAPSTTPAPSPAPTPAPAAPPAAASPPPAVQVVTLPPVTKTKSSAK